MYVSVCVSRDLFRAGSKYIYINRVDHFKLPINTAISIRKRSYEHIATFIWNEIGNYANIPYTYIHISVIEQKR